MIVIRAAIVCDGRVVRDLATFDYGVNDPLQTLLALDHLDDESPLQHLVLLLDVELELLIATSNLGNHILSLHFHVDLVDTNKVECALDPYDGNGDDHFVNHSFDFVINFDSFSWLELHWSFHEELLALVLDLAFRDTAKVDFAHDKMLVIGVLLLFQEPCLLDLVDLVDFFCLELSEGHVQMCVPVVADSDQSLPFLFLTHTSLPSSFLLLLLEASSVLFKSAVSFSLGSQVVLTPLPQHVVLLLRNHGNASPLLFFHLAPALLLFLDPPQSLEQVELELLVLLKGKIEDVRVRRAAFVAQLDGLEDLIRVLPILCFQEEAKVKC